MPQITVIVPVYRVEAWLGRCVDSILNQTFGDFELVLVDDGSPDRCPEICEEYARRDSRVVVLHQKNRGLSAARNLGLDWAEAHSDSPWICFVDSDDWVHPRYLEYLHRAAVEQGTAVSVCNLVRTSREESFGELPWRCECRDAMAVYREDHLLITVAWNKLYAASLFRGMRYPRGRIHEDEFLTYKLLYAAGTFAWVDVPLYCYFQREDSIMASRSWKASVHTLLANVEQAAFFRTRNRELYRLKCRDLREIAANAMGKLLPNRNA